MPTYLILFFFFEGKIKNAYPGQWIRKLGQMETALAAAGYMKSYNTVQGVYVTSEEPLPRDVFETALQHLVRCVSQEILQNILQMFICIHIYI